MSIYSISGILEIQSEYLSKRYIYGLQKFEANVNLPIIMKSPGSLRCRDFRFNRHD